MLICFHCVCVPPFCQSYLFSLLAVQVLGVQGNFPEFRAEKLVQLVLWKITIQGYVQVNSNWSLNINIFTVGRSWIMREDLQIHDPMIWTWKSHDLDQKSLIFFLIWTKKTCFIFWSGSKICFFFLIWIKNWLFDFWSGPKIPFLFFDLDQKLAI